MSIVGWGQRKGERWRGEGRRQGTRQHPVSPWVVEMSLPTGSTAGTDPKPWRRKALWCFQIAGTAGSLPKDSLRVLQRHIKRVDEKKPCRWAQWMHQWQPV